MGAMRALDEPMPQVGILRNEQPSSRETMLRATRMCRLEHKQVHCLRRSEFELQYFEFVYDEHLVYSVRTVA